MSNLVYPANIPGLTFGSSRTPTFNTGVQEALTGKESRIAYQYYPRMKWELQYELLRDYVAPSDLRALFGLFMQMKGKFDTFLYSDPVFNSVTNEQFAIADGTSGPFQIVATYRNLPLNLLEYSNGPFGASPWTIYNVSLSPTTTVSPDGTQDATRLTGLGPNGYIASDLVQAPVTALAEYTFSIYARCISGTQVVPLLIQDQTTAIIAATTVTLTTAWQRVSVTGAAHSGSTTAYVLFGGGAFGTGDVAEVFGAQLEAGITPSVYQPTTITAYGPGSPELIQNFNGTPQIFVNGTLSTINTNYTLDGTGNVTFNSSYVPSAGAILTWSGSFYYRVRFDDDDMDFSQFLANFWEAKKVVLKQIKL